MLTIMNVYLSLLVRYKTDQSFQRSMLDDPLFINNIDKSGMLRTVLSFPEQIEDSIRIAKDADISLNGRVIDNIVVSGMGGSAISGDIIQSWLRDSIDIPIFVNRDYNLPKWVDKNTFAIFLSYSGNTEETINSFDDACSRGSFCMAISSGGLIKERCLKRSCSYLKIPSGFQPRAATAYLLFPTIKMLEVIGILSSSISNDLNEVVEVTKIIRDANKIDVSENKSKAKNIAKSIYRYLPNIYGWNYFAPIAKRWRTQLNENSKIIARDDVVSECNHNDIVGWSFNPDVSKNSVCILLRDKNNEPMQITKRFEFMRRLFEEVADDIIEVDAIGNSLLARMISVMYVGDLVSVYLAILRGVDPTPVDVITKLKRELSGDQL